MSLLRAGTYLYSIAKFVVRNWSGQEREAAPSERSSMPAQAVHLPHIADPSRQMEERWGATIRHEQCHALYENVLTQEQRSLFSPSVIFNSTDLDFARLYLQHYFLTHAVKKPLFNMLMRALRKSGINPPTLNTGAASFTSTSQRQGLSYVSRLERNFRHERFAVYGSIMGTKDEVNLHMQYRLFFFNLGFASMEDINQAAIPPQISPELVEAES
ncbi:MAG: hypothetical protein ABID35_07835 [Candidatus Margulisiibacteriota bacterium]